jgi:hypothetical protein
MGPHYGSHQIDSEKEDSPPHIMGPPLWVPQWTFPSQEPLGRPQGGGSPRGLRSSPKLDGHRQPHGRAAPPPTQPPTPLPTPPTHQTTPPLAPNNNHDTPTTPPSPQPPPTHPTHNNPRPPQDTELPLLELQPTILELSEIAPMHVPRLAYFACSLEATSERKRCRIHIFDIIDTLKYKKH